MTAPNAGRGWGWKEAVALSGLLVVALLVFTWHNDFPYTLHADEAKKVSYILGNAPDFHHPLLLIQLGRGIRAVMGWSGGDGAALAGRWGSALAGLALLGGFYVWARPRLGGALAWVGAAVLGASPLVAVHAHYVKEDVVLTAAVMGVMLALRRWRVETSGGAAGGLGAALGLAAASHYKSVVVLVLLAWSVRDRTVTRSEWGWMWGMATVVFLAINLPIFFEPAVFLSGAGTMFTGAVGGVEVDIYPVPFAYAFHLTRSLAPGMGWGVLAWAAVGMGVIWRAGKAASFEDRMAILAPVVFYLVVEFLPKKPPPDYGRYVLPCAPFVVWLALRGVQAVWHAVARPWGRGLVVIGALAAVGQPTLAMWRIVGAMGHDTRVRAPAWVEARRQAAAEAGWTMVVVAEDYAATSVQNVRTVYDLDLAAVKAAGVTHVLVSSFRYERYLQGANLAQQRPEVHDTAAFYRALFAQPYDELRPDGPSYAFLNPTLRLVDIRAMNFSDEL